MLGKNRLSLRSPTLFLFVNDASVTPLAPVVNSVRDFDTMCSYIVSSRELKHDSTAIYMSAGGSLGPPAGLIGYQPTLPYV